MTEQTPVQRQYALENTAKELGTERLRDRTKVAEERTYASSTVYGLAALRGGLEAITSLIAQGLAQIDNGQPQQYADGVAFVKHMDPSVLALITAKMVLDHSQTAFPKNTYALLCNIIGTRIYDQHMLEEFERQQPDAFATTERFQKGKRKGYSYKVQDFRAKMRRVKLEAPVWPPQTKHKVGAWMLERLSKATGWIEENVRQIRKKTVRLIYPSREFQEQKGNLLQLAERFCWIQWPMLCKPVPWCDERRGGYLTPELRSKFPMIRRKHLPPKGGPTHILEGKLNGTPALRALNRVQQTPFRINPIVYWTANDCWNSDVSIGKFHKLYPIDPPTKPDWETATDEEKLSYRRERTRIEDHNHTISQKNYCSYEALEVAKRFLDEKELYFPWSFDYRGRMYPVSTAITPQGTDFEKAILLFAEEGPVDEYWLAFQVATTFGLSKATMEERQQWVRDNLGLISRVANDPFVNRQEWMDVEEPWCFLAAVVEYNDCVIEKKRSTSSLPISVDATCSGLQHLAGLTLDRSAAALVNVLPTERPTDAYQVVADKAKEFLPESVHPLLNRKVTKRTVMTIPYGVTMNSARDYIRQELPKELPEGVTLSDIVRAVYKEAVPEVIPGPINAMGFIQRSVADKVKETGSTSIRWVTPSGFTVVQDLRKVEIIRIETRLLGAMVKTSLNLSSDKPDISHHRGASAPNLIHSLDATLLHLVFSSPEWRDRKKAIHSMIHDCVLVRSCDMDQMQLSLRDKFVELYSKPVLKDWATQIGAPFDDSVMQNTLDISLAKGSAHLFC